MEARGLGATQAEFWTGGDLAGTVAALSIATADTQRQLGRALREAALHARQQAFHDRIDEMKASALAGLVGGCISAAGTGAGGAIQITGGSDAGGGWGAVAKGTAEAGSAVSGFIAKGHDIDAERAKHRQDVAQEALDEADEMIESSGDRTGRAFDAMNEMRRSIDEATKAALRG